MSFDPKYNLNTGKWDKLYPNRKDRRKQYRGAKAFDKSCRCHGGCPYCKNSRLYKRNLVEEASLYHLNNID